LSEAFQLAWTDGCATGSRTSSRGDGSSPCSLSRADIGRPIAEAASFPTLFSTASGVFGLVAGPPSLPVLERTEFLSEAFQLAWTDGCATGSRTSSRHVYDLLFRVLTSLLQVSHRFWRRVCPKPRVSPLNSQVAFRSQVSGTVFNIADSSEGFHEPCPGQRVLPASCALFVPPFSVFHFG